MKMTKRQIPENPTFDDVAAILARLVRVEDIYEYGYSRVMWEEIRWEDDPDIDGQPVLCPSGAERRLRRVDLGYAVPPALSAMSCENML